MHFEATEENKLIYMDIFKSYQEQIEAFILTVYCVLNLVAFIGVSAKLQPRKIPLLGRIAQKPDR